MQREEEGNGKQRAGQGQIAVEHAAGRAARVAARLQPNTVAEELPAPLGWRYGPAREAAEEVPRRAPRLQLAGAENLKQYQLEQIRSLLKEEGLL